MTERDVLLAERFHFFVGDLDRGRKNCWAMSVGTKADRMTTVTNSVYCASLIR